MRARAAICLALALSAVAPGAARAQEQPSGEAALEAARRASGLRDFGARSIVRTALIDLRLRARPQAQDFRLASLLMGLAQELRPQDEELARWQVSLAEAGEDHASVERQLRRVLELSPRDTVAQYRLISLRVRRTQAIDQRLAMYEQVLGPAGASFDPSIRSRLAFEAASLLRERGDESGFVAKLKIATSLDPTNKEAAAAALLYFAEKSRDQMGRLELVGNLLSADPTEPTAHLELAHELFAGGAFEQAKRFQTNAMAVFERAGADRGTPGLLEELAIEWPVDGPASVADRLNRAIDIRRDKVGRFRKELEENLQPTTGIPTKEDVRLDPVLDRVRLLAAKTAGDAATADRAMADLRKWYDEAFVQLKSTTEKPAGDADPVAVARALRLELATLLLWADAAPEIAAQDIEGAAAEPGTDPQDPDLLEARGWSMARGDDAAGAVEVLNPLAEDRPIARLGLGVAHERLGHKAEAVAEYARVVREQPMTTEACWALGRLKALTGSQIPDAALARKMKAFADGIPSLIDDMAREPRVVMSLDAEVAASSALPTEGALLRVTLSNMSPMPLGVGPGRTVDSRVLVSPSIEMAMTTLQEGAMPEILDMGRRLRLMPRETIEVMFWPDPGLTGWLAETNCDRTVRQLWRLLQGFVRGASGSIEAGPTCLSASTRTLLRAPLPETSLTPAQLGLRLESAPDEELPALALAARNRLLALGRVSPEPKKAGDISDLSAPVGEARPLLGEPEMALIAQGAVRCYARAGELGRRVLLCALPHGGQVPAMKAFDDLARAETDPATLCLVLVTRVKDPKDPLLAACKPAADPRLAEVARLMEERLTAGAPCTAGLGPGLTGLVGAAPGESK